MEKINNLSYILQQDCQLDTSRLVLIGVSGGPDSLCLLDIMWRLEYPLVVAHLNHGLRTEAVEDESSVREAALLRGLPYILETADVPAYARIHHLSIEEAARSVRYQFLFKQARLYQAQVVAVAHTADDQVETILMHLLRGAGLSGLKGMSYRSQHNPWSSDIALVRPLLGIFRDEVLRYCSDRDLHPVFDRSNLDTTFYRNRIRKELIPALETYNAGIKTSLERMAQTLSGDDQVLETLTTNAWQACCIELGTDGVALRISGLLTQPLGIQRRLVRRTISFLRPGLRDFNFAMIDKVLSFILQPMQGGQSDLASGLRLLREGDKLWISNWHGNMQTDDWPQMVDKSTLLPVPGIIGFPGGWHIQAEVVINHREAMIQAMNNADPCLAWIDLLDYHSTFTVRPPLPGDRFQPLGMNYHSLKLSDFFINEKIPRRARHRWPLVCLGNEIAWIPGYRIAHPHRLTPGSTRCIFLQLTRD